MSIGKRMAKGAAWMVAARMINRLIGVVSTIVLARILVPADFGLVSMAMSIIAMLEVLGNFGFDTILIQNQQAERKHYDTAWTCNVLFGLACSATLLMFAAPAARFFREPRLETVVMILAVLPAIRGLQNIGIVEFRKRLDFGKEFRFLLFKKLSSFVVVVPLAIIFRNYWALVIGSLVGVSVGLALSYLLQPYRPRPNLEARRELFGFSKWFVLSGILQVVLERAPEFIVGRISGPRSLGLFNISHEIAYLPTSELVMPINRAAFPGYAKKTASLETLRDGFLNVWSMICLFMIPAAVGVCLTADLVVPVFLGDKWIDAIPLVRLLAIAGLLYALQTNPSYVLMALGKPRLATLTTMAFVAVLLPLMVVATRAAGPLGAALAYVATAAVILPVRCAILQREVHLRLSSLLGRVWRPLLSTAIMFAVVVALRSMLPETANLGTQMFQFILVVLTGALTYTGAGIGLWRLSGSPDGGERFLLGIAGQKLSSLHRKLRTLRAPRSE